MQIFTFQRSFRRELFIANRTNPIDTAMNFHLKAEAMNKAFDCTSSNILRVD